MPGIITKHGIVRGSAPVAAVREDVKLRAIIEAQGRLANAWQRRAVLGDTEAVSRAEANFDHVYIECYGRRRDTLENRASALSPRQVYGRQLFAKVARLTAEAKAHTARRSANRRSVAINRGTRPTMSAGPLPDCPTMEQLIELSKGMW